MVGATIKGAGGSLVLNCTVAVINCEYGQMTNVFTMLSRAMIGRFNRECRLIVMAGEIRKYTAYRKRWPRIRQAISKTNTLVP